jgi:DNA-directed RNA polymerase specialized sigma subunit
MQLSDFIAHDDVDKKIEIQEAIGQLGHTDRAVLYLWVIGYTQEEIAQMFGFSQSKICRILGNLHKSINKVAVVYRDYCEN